MHIFTENDTVCLVRPVEGDVIGERRRYVLPIGTVATIVLVHGDPDQPMAYEVEAYVSEQDCYVLATIESTDV